MMSLRKCVVTACGLILMAGPAAAQVDFSGEWRSLAFETGGDPRLGEYVGLPLSDDGRAVAEAWDPSVLTLPELQCRPHPIPYAEQTPGNPANAQFRWWKEIDPVTQNTIAYRKRGAWMEPERTIWMDGRPHPPEYAPHTWQGFSTGEWITPMMLKVTTTHIKEGFIRRNGAPVSDRTTVTEYFVRHGNMLSSTLYIDDPVYLAEPLVSTNTWILDPRIGPQLQQRYPCGPNEIADEVIRPKGEVPHYLPGTNSAILREFAAKYRLPYEATRGGAETVYPEYMQKLKTMRPETPQPATR
jgi:hypothetical protein